MRSIMQLNSRIIGSGTALVVLHGLFGMSDNWVTIGNRLAASGFNVHLLDLRNHGNSPHAASHRYPDMCEDLMEYYDRHDLDKPTVLGHSMGGKLGMVFSLLEPESVANLVVVDIAPSSYQYPGNKHHHTIIQTLKQLDLATFDKRGTIREELAARLGDHSLAQFLAKNITRDATQGTFCWKFNLPVLEKFLQHIYIGLDELSIYAPCPVKTLFIKGGSSSYYLEEHESDRNYFFPDSTLCEIPDAGHWLHSEQPDLFTETVLDFLC